MVIDPSRGRAGSSPPLHHGLVSRRKSTFATRSQLLFLSYHACRCQQDEPDGNRVPPARVHQGYQLLKAADPTRPVFVCLDTIPPTASAGPLWHDYVNATDVVISDTYPVGNVDAKPADRNVLAVFNTIATYKNYTPPAPAVLPPVVVVPNAFGGGEVWPREADQNEKSKIQNQKGKT